MEERVKVLFIAGWGRSGSTILASLLGQLEGFLSIGELTSAWDIGLLKNRLCGCSVPFRECTLWREAVDGLLQEPSEEIERIVELRESFRTRDCFWPLIGRNRSRLGGTLREYAPLLGEIYRNLHAATGCSVIVDSSKDPSHGYVIDSIPDIDLHVLHLVRDPRAVAFSWRRKKLQLGMDKQRYMVPHGTMESSLHWVARNFLIEGLWGHREGIGRYRRLHYEELVRRPRETLIEIRDMLEQDSEVDFFSGPQTVTLRPTHQIWGNPSRFQSGETKIVSDREWSTEMSWNSRLLATAVALPMLVRYGYLGSDHREEERS